MCKHCDSFVIMCLVILTRQGSPVIREPPRACCTSLLSFAEIFIVLVLLSASVKTVGVSRMRDFLLDSLN